MRGICEYACRKRVAGALKACLEVGGWRDVRISLQQKARLGEKGKHVVQNCHVDSDHSRTLDCDVESAEGVGSRAEVALRRSSGWEDREGEADYLPCSGHKLVIAFPCGMNYRPLWERACTDIITEGK